MKSILVKPGEYKFTQMPMGDKSVTHRALILASLADKPTLIKNANISADALATAECMRALGAKINRDGTTFFVTPFDTPDTGVTLNCQNSGTTARLLAGLVSGLGIRAKFLGDMSLARRPMPMLEPLALMGAKITFPEDALFEVEPSGLRAIDYISPKPSAQLKSAVLLAGLNAKGVTSVYEPVITRRHTEEMLSLFGADISQEKSKITLRAGKLRSPEEIDIPNDFSTAAYFLLLGLKRQISLTGLVLSKERVGFLTLLSNAGAKIEVEMTDPKNHKGSVTITPSEIKPLFADKNLVPDMIDEVVLACVAACLAKGESVFSGLSDLRGKETDRIRTAVKLIAGLGEKAEVKGDSIHIYGRGFIRGGTVTTFFDHRIAMAGVVAGLMSERGVSVDDTEIISISSHNFLQMLDLEKP